MLDDDQWDPMCCEKKYLPVVTGGCRGNAKNRRVPEQLSHVWVLVPDDLLKLRRFLASSGAVAFRRSHGHAHHIG